MGRKKITDFKILRQKKGARGLLTTDFEPMDTVVSKCANYFKSTKTFKGEDLK